MQAEIQAEVARLEHTLSHTTMPLKEEKEVLVQIRELRKSRDAIKAVADRAGKLGDGDAGRRDVAGRLRAKESEVSALAAERAGVSAALASLRSAEEAKGVLYSTDALRKERDVAWAALGEARSASRAARDKFRADNDAWWAAEQAARAAAEAERAKKRVVVRGLDERKSVTCPQPVF